MLGLDNPLHIAFLLVLLLLVFGAKRLPEMGKSLGEGLRGFKNSLSGEDAAPAQAAETTPALVSAPQLAGVPAGQPVRPEERVPETAGAAR